jgi:hypothetical protein
MSKDEGILKNLLIWSYERGTLQYDIICALILAFVFFMPPSCFVAKREAIPPQVFGRSASNTTHSEKAINPAQPEPQRKRN